MKWTGRQLTLPLLVGVSLTGVCIGIYYFLYKKEKENVNKTIILKDKQDHVIKVKVPRQHVPAVIGRGGRTIKDVEQRTNTRIRFNEDDVTIPDRICIIRGTFESAKLAESFINGIIENQPIIETYEMFVPQRVRSALSADRCELLHSIQASTHTKIILEKGYSHNPDEKKRIIIKGSAEQIAAALYHIEDMASEMNKIREKLEVNQCTRSPRTKVSPRKSSIVNKIETQVQLEESCIVQEGSMEVYVSAINNPNQFWVQVVGPGILALDELVTKMTTYYNNEENRQSHVLTNLTVGQMVAAKFSFDNQWYRAEVTAFLDNERCEVFFVDYGDHEVMNQSDVMELRTDFLSERLQAIECSLANIKPKDDEWSQQACDRFSDLCWCAQWKIIIAKVCGFKERVIGEGKCRREGSPIPCVDLFDINNNSDINIGKQMIIENLAIADEGTWSAANSTLSLSKQNDNTLSSSASPAQPSKTSISTSKDDIAVDVTTPQKRPMTAIQEIDLTTPKMQNRVIEEIDLITPKHNDTREFIEREIKISKHENGSGDHGLNTAEFPTSSQWTRTSSIAPGGYESEDEDPEQYGFD